MLKHLISLVFLLILFINKPIYAESNTKILPEPKPKRILNFFKEKKDNLLPQKKPSFIVNNVSKDNKILPKNKPIVENIIIKKKIEKDKKVLPQKKSEEKIIEIVDNSISLYWKENSLDELTIISNTLKKLLILLQKNNYIQKSSTERIR